MKIELTKDVSHKANGDYTCVLVQFEDEDKHYFHNKKNWMPKDVEVLALVQMLCSTSRTFKKRLKEWMEEEEGKLIHIPEN